jgi:hypothetical protein
MKLITPQNAIQIVLARKTKDARFCPYETILEGRLFWAALGFFSLGIALALLAYVFKNNVVIGAAMGAVGLSILFVLAYQVVSTVPDLLKLRNIEREISEPLLDQFNDDMDLINELISTFERHHLEYARDRYCLMAKQLRERIALLVGALEKVGVIPLAVTGYLSFLKAQKEGLAPFGGLEWIFVAFLGLFIFALRMATAAQWMEKIAGIYAQAVSRYERKN